MITGCKLERCPFCKSTQAYPHLRKSPCQVRCGTCGAEGPEAQSVDDAIDRWNRLNGKAKKDGDNHVLEESWMKGNQSDSCLYIIFPKSCRIRGRNPVSLLREAIDAGWNIYCTAEGAELGRERRDAYENPGDGKVIGFEIHAFLPRNRKMRLR